MKIGIYHHPSTTHNIRCVDGKFDLLPNEHFGSPDKAWEFYSSHPGIPCDQAAILSKLRSCGSLGTYCRSIAKTLYGIPDDVELYVCGDMGIETELAGKINKEG